jgi:5S rRNA maturation endonuclease (ribonuclease M5)
MAQDDVVTLVKERCPIEDVIGETIPLSGRGRWWRGSGSGYHNLVVDCMNGAYHWNVQGEHGDVIAWVMKRRSVDFKTAVEALCARAGLPEPTWGREDTAHRVASRAKEEALSVAVGVMAGWLWKDADALAYVRGRGWTDETIRGGLLGYSGLGSQRKALGEEMRQAMAAAGVDLESAPAVAILGKWGEVAGWMQAQGLEVRKDWAEGGFVPGILGRDMLVYPHVVNGRVKYVSGRGVHEKNHYNLPELLVGKRQPYFAFSWAAKEDKCVVVEGQADAITLAQWGVAAVALAGTAADEDLSRALKDHKALYVGLDADKAGEVGAWKMGRVLGPLTRLINWRQVRPEWRQFEGADGQIREVKDANDLLKAMRPQIGEGGEDASAGSVNEARQAEAVQGLLDAAPTFAEMICAWAGKQVGAERDEALHTAMVEVNKLPDFPRRSYRVRLAELLKISLREYDSLLKAVEGRTEDEQDGGEPVLTWGGTINGWLVEYLYDPETERSLLAWRDPAGKIGAGDEVTINGRRYLPMPPDAFVTKGVIIFPSGLGERKGIAELIAYIEMFLQSAYLFPSAKMIRLVAYWVLTTWMYESFETTIYLRAIGGAGSGKSEMMRRVGLLCYRLMVANGAGSTSSFFRAVEQYGGTVFIDEADMEQSDTQNDMVKFYNLGAMKGNTFWRVEKSMGSDGVETMSPTFYRVFCPKLVAMRKEFKDDAVGSRSLTFKMQGREMTELVAGGISLTINNEMRQRAQGLRNLLLRWRLENWQEQIEVDPSFYDLTISARLNQVAGPLLSIAREDLEQQDDIRRTLREYYAETILTQNMTLAARVLEAMWKIWQWPDLHEQMVKHDPAIGPCIQVNNVTKITNQIINMMNDEEEDDEDGKKKSSQEVKSRRVGSILRGELQFEISGRKEDGYFVYWNEPRMIGLSTKFGINRADFGPKPANAPVDALAKPPTFKQGALV